MFQYSIQSYFLLRNTCPTTEIKKDKCDILPSLRPVGLPNHKFWNRHFGNEVTVGLKFDFEYTLFKSYIKEISKFEYLELYRNIFIQKPHIVFKYVIEKKRNTVCEFIPFHRDSWIYDFDVHCRIYLPRV